jgi:signal transduction histidine kinase
LLFLVFTGVLFIFVFFATAGQVALEADNSVAREFEQLSAAYDSGGMRVLNQEVVERSAAGGPLFYLLADTTGEPIAGDYDALPILPDAGEPPRFIDFPVRPRGEETDAGQRARGLIGRVLNGPVLMVARDQRESRVAAQRMTNALTLATLMSVAFSIAIGLIAAWHVSRRVEALSATTRRVMGGDLNHRAPVMGWGDEFDLFAGDMNAMLDRLEQLVHATRNAGDAIAHDLRTPLARMRQRLDAALDQPADVDTDRDALRKAQEETERLLRTFNAVLQLSRLKSASSWRFEVVDLSEIIAEVVDLYEPAAEEAGVRFSSEATPGLAVKGDSRLVAQAMANLLDNALKYTPAGEIVRVSCLPSADETMCLITVADSGPGIRHEDRERVKERFVRLEAHRQSEGAGLGLALVAAVAELHGGDFALEDGLPNAVGGRGLSAVLRLPVARR